MNIFKYRWAYYLDAFSSYLLCIWLSTFTMGMITSTLEKGPLNALMPTPDMDRTISQRIE